MTNQQKKEADQAELEIWAREKTALENYSQFYTDKLEPFTRNLLSQIGSQPVTLSGAAQQLDIFGIRHE